MYVQYDTLKRLINLKSLIFMYYFSLKELLSILTMVAIGKSLTSTKWISSTPLLLPSVHSWSLEMSQSKSKFFSEIYLYIRKSILFNVMLLLFFFKFQVLIGISTSIGFCWRAYQPWSMALVSPLDWAKSLLHCRYLLADWNWRSRTYSITWVYSNETWFCGKQGDTILIASVLKCFHIFLGRF